MTSLQTSELNERLPQPGYQPAVSIFLPFDPKMDSRGAIQHEIKLALNEAEMQLQQYPANLRQLVMEKLWNITDHLNFGTHKKNVAIYVSPYFEKVIYMDIRLAPRVSVGPSFAIRDIVYSKKTSQEYLVLAVSGTACGIYRGDGDKLTKIVSHGVGGIQDVINETTDRSSNPTHPKETLPDTFLRSVDDSLGILLNAYHLPLFVIGPAKVVAQFKKLSTHTAAVIGYAHGNYDNTSTPVLQLMLRPYLQNWKETRQKSLLKMVDNAAGSQLLAIGMRNVWRAASNARGKLLLLERDYMYNAQQGGNKPVIYMPAKPYNKYSPVQDAVDDIIEKVLESGGDVEFADQDLLKNYQHIALVQYY
jgi:hypothetical protein